MYWIAASIDSLTKSLQNTEVRLSDPIFEYQKPEKVQEKGLQKDLPDLKHLEIS
jgi:hypothetical protein